MFFTQVDFIRNFVINKINPSKIKMIRRRKRLLKQYPEYPIVCDVNIGMMGDDWPHQKINEVNQWLDENFPNLWKLLTHYSEQGFDCAVFYHFANEEISVAFKLRWA